MGNERLNEELIYIHQPYGSTGWTVASYKDLKWYANQRQDGVFKDFYLIY